VVRFTHPTNMASTTETGLAGFAERSKEEWCVSRTLRTWRVPQRRGLQDSRNAARGVARFTYPTNMGFELAWSFLWVMSRPSVRSCRVPMRNITHGDEMVSVNIFQPGKRFSSRGPPEKNPKKCTILHNHLARPAGRWRYLVGLRKPINRGSTLCAWRAGLPGTEAPP